jgi:hypothetical protein
MGDQQAVIHAAKVVYRLYTEMFQGLPRGPGTGAPCACLNPWWS